MGFTLPAAIGAQLAQPDAQVLAICGDGDFLQTMQELATAAMLGSPVCTVVLDNSGWISIKGGQEAHLRPHRRHRLPPRRQALLAGLRGDRPRVRHPHASRPSDPTRFAPRSSARWPAAARRSSMSAWIATWPWPDPTRPAGGTCRSPRAGRSTTTSSAAAPRSSSDEPSPVPDRLRADRLEQRRLARPGARDAGGDRARRDRAARIRRDPARPRLSRGRRAARGAREARPALRGALLRARRDRGWPRAASGRHRQARPWPAHRRGRRGARRRRRRRRAARPMGRARRGWSSPLARGRVRRAGGAAAGARGRRARLGCVSRSTPTPAPGSRIPRRSQHSPSASPAPARGCAWTSGTAWSVAATRSTPSAGTARSSPIVHAKDVDPAVLARLRAGELIGLAARSASESSPSSATAHSTSTACCAGWTASAMRVG